MENGSLEMFSFTNDFINENNLCSNFITKISRGHLKCLEKQFKKYFQPDFDTNQFDWVRNPFNVSIENVSHLSLNTQEKFAELSSDTI